MNNNQISTLKNQYASIDHFDYMRLNRITKKEEEKLCDMF